MRSPRPGTSLNGKASALRDRRIARDMTGEQHGTWTVLGRAEGRATKKNGVPWDCRCSRCGAQRTINGDNLRTRAPGCSECDAPSMGGRQKRERLSMGAVAERGRELLQRQRFVWSARCTACQSFAGFEAHAPGQASRCLCCGLSGTAEFLEHVVAPRRVA